MKQNPAKRTRVLRLLAWGACMIAASVFLADGAAAHGKPGKHKGWGHGGHHHHFRKPPAVYYLPPPVYYAPPAYHPPAYVVPPLGFYRPQPRYHVPGYIYDPSLSLKFNFRF